MPLKNILVHIDDSPRCEVRLALGLSLARAHEAHLTGIYAMAPPYIPAYMAAQVGATVTVETPKGEKAFKVLKLV